MLLTEARQMKVDVESLIGLVRQRSTSFDASNGGENVLQGFTALFLVASPLLGIFLGSGPHGFNSTTFTATRPLTDGTSPRPLSAALWSASAVRPSSGWWAASPRWRFRARSVAGPALLVDSRRLRHRRTRLADLAVGPRLLDVCRLRGFPGDVSPLVGGLEWSGARRTVAQHRVCRESRARGPGGGVDRACWCRLPELHRRRLYRRPSPRTAVGPGRVRLRGRLSRPADLPPRHCTHGQNP